MHVPSSTLLPIYDNSKHYDSVYNEIPSMMNHSVEHEPHQNIMNKNRFRYQN